MGIDKLNECIFIKVSVLAKGGPTAPSSMFFPKYATNNLTKLGKLIIKMCLFSQLKKKKILTKNPTIYLKLLFSN